MQKGMALLSLFLTVNNIDKCWVDESLSFIFSEAENSWFIVNIMQ